MTEATTTLTRTVAYSRQDLVTSYNIDVVRFYLAQWVIVSHIAEPLLGIPLIPGRLAIWGFFVLSGYVNALSYQRASTHPDAIGHYFVSRIRRIFPMLILSYAIVSLATGNFINQDLLVIFPVAYFYNFDLLNGVMWTLALELQFYIVTPWIVSVLSTVKARLSFLLAVCAALVFVIPLLHVWLMNEWRFIDDRTALGNIGFYAFGILLALRREEALMFWGKIRIWALFILTFYAGAYLSIYNIALPNYKGILLGVPLIFVGGMAAIATSRTLHASMRGFFTFIGKATYEIYVFHGLGGFILTRLDMVSNTPLLLFTVWLMPVLAAWVLSSYQALKARPR